MSLEKGISHETYLFYYNNLVLLLHHLLSPCRVCPLPPYSYDDKTIQLDILDILGLFG